MQFQMTHTFGLAGLANLQSQRTGVRVDACEARQPRCEEMVVEYKRRIAEMEARLGW